MNWGLRNWIVAGRKNVCTTALPSTSKPVTPRHATSCSNVGWCCHALLLFCSCDLGRKLNSGRYFEFKISVIELKLYIHCFVIAWTPVSVSSCGNGHDQETRSWLTCVAYQMFQMMRTCVAWFAREPLQTIRRHSKCRESSNITVFDVVTWISNENATGSGAGSHWLQTCVSCACRYLLMLIDDECCFYLFTTTII